MSYREVYKSYKYKIEPTDTQKSIINQSIGNARFIYNYFLDLNIKRYDNGDKKLSHFDMNYQIPKLKKQEGFEWLSLSDSLSLVNAAQDLDIAYTNFFRGLKKSSKVGFPNFKRKSYGGSYRTSGKSIVIDSNSRTIKLPKLGNVKLRLSQKCTGVIKSVTVSRSSTGRYSVSILVVDYVFDLDKTDKVVGLDLGLTDFIVDSDGLKIPNIKNYISLNDKLIKEKRKLSRRYLLAKKRGVRLADASNYQKQRLKVAKLEEKITNKRRDFLHKLSTSYIKSHDIICIEDLNVKGLVRNHKLARTLSDAAWSEFRRQLEYKADWYGKKIQVVGRFYASTKTCNVCGVKSDGFGLDVREWECKSCGSLLDRDLNAAHNIRDEGLRFLVVT